MAPVMDAFFIATHFELRIKNYELRIMIRDYLAVTVFTI